MSDYIKLANEVPITEILNLVAIDFDKNGKLNFCPFCQVETDHASFPSWGNFVKCWACDENLSCVSIYSLMKNKEREKVLQKRFANQSLMLLHFSNSFTFRLKKQNENESNLNPRVRRIAIAILSTVNTSVDLSFLYGKRFYI